MAHLKAGRSDALAVLFNRYHRLVLSIALKIVRDPGEAEDVMQCVFLEIFRSVAQFDPAKGTTKVWILQYAYHRAINRRQHLNVRSFYNQANLDQVETRLPETASILGGFTQHELKHLLQQGLATLNGPQKKVVELASFNGQGDRRQNGRLSIECTASLLSGTSETAIVRPTHPREGKGGGRP